LDGGVRSGIDVLRAVALGARGVLIGRPWVWATAGAGEQGLVDLLATFHSELRTAMALAGVARIADAGPDLLDLRRILAPHGPANGCGCRRSPDAGVLRQEEEP
ncbi:MAG: alpha-hydroxy-acid oxidizing protein, partial [Steroidobacteraceae bacterium]|nr:alpha-hydroxy-acid oxidizing protein [Steroidobacteraceae bacterium]